MISITCTIKKTYDEIIWNIIEVHQSSVYHCMIFFTGNMAVSPDGLSPRAKNIYDRVKDFIEKEVKPTEKQVIDFYKEEQNRWKVCPIITELKVLMNDINKLINISCL